MERAHEGVVGLGGGCHWCTEAVFQSLRGVSRVEQGWIRSDAPDDAWSEAVVVYFDPSEISLDALIDVHLHTHSSASDHSMRAKYRSAVYSFGEDEHASAERALAVLGKKSEKPLVTRVLPFRGFRLGTEDFLDYYQTRPDAPFCRTYIDPKLSALRKTHGALVKGEAKALRRAAGPTATAAEPPSPVVTWREVIRRANHGNPAPPRRAEKSDAEWRAILTDEQYRVTRQQETERPHSSDVCERFEPGRYACACCHALLFDADAKLGSRSGWPSFAQPADSSAVAYRKDDRHAMVRVEASCAACDAHLGHVSPDGPPPGGLRYCINGTALALVDALLGSPPHPGAARNARHEKR